MEIRQLVEKAQAGDRSAFAELVRRYQKVAISKAWSVAHDFHVAQDLAQEAFVIAFKSLATLRNPASFGPWLLEIVRRQSIRTLSRHERFRVLEDPYAHPGLEFNPSRMKEHWQEEFALVLDALNKLPEHEQDVVVLFYLEGLSSKQVATYVDRPVGTVTKQISRGIARLRQFLSEVAHEQ